MRLIDADALLMDNSWDFYDENGNRNDACIAVENAPTVDAEPVKYGHWCFEEFPDGYYHWECSECKKWFKEDSMSLAEEWKYCPNCGAKMDDVKEDEAEDLPSADTPQEWIPCSERLPNDDEILYDGIAREGRRYVSDRILAIDKDGFMRIGYFMNAMDAPRFGKRYEFGEHYRNDPTKWICGESREIYDPIAWMPLPKPYVEEEG